MEALNAGFNAIVGRMPPTVMAIWSVFALLMVIAVLVAVFYERRRFAAQNQAGAWLFVRLATLPIAAAATAAVVIPARAIGGPEALAAFYLLAITAGPLVYFGLHWFAGLAAGLARKDGLAIGLSGLLMVLVPVLLANQVQPWVFNLARAMDGTGAAPGSNFSPGVKRPPLHQVLEQQRFTVPEIGEVWTERWQAPAGVRIERIELNVRGQYVPVDNASSNYLCRNGEDVHVFWHGAVAPANWRVHWRDANDQRAYSDWTMTPPVAATVAFTPEWLPDGFALPVRVPGGLVTYSWMRENGREDSRGVVDQYAAAGTGSPCVQTLRRPVTTEQPQISGMGLRLWRFDTQQMLYALFRRPAAAVTVSADTRRETTP
ncbi:hypothetical protein [Dechloromonas sp. H13]|uniref:hypothetical protein n=1 Tax=Dechloromonas sp. H13 TaxID=2570193 RepID=UPI001291F4DE|nr:hypothetical protein [Dechloromonas sp. H13]